MNGKIYQQDLYYWCHWENTPKWWYDKNHNVSWVDFYPARHNPPSEEKLVNLYRNGGGNASQIWALKISNYCLIEHLSNLMVKFKPCYIR